MTFLLGFITGLATAFGAIAIIATVLEFWPKPNCECCD